MGDVIVEYDYIAKEPDELTIKKGDIIQNVVKKQGGWWEGVLKDKKGMFPDNFVRALDKDSQVVLRDKKDVSRIRQCRVVFSYNQDHEDELNLNVGDIIKIIGEEEEGWWRGLLNGKEGVFPSNFVEEIVVQPPHPKPSSREDIAGSASDAELRVPKLPIKPSKQLCEVKFPYKNQNEDELSLKVGDIITLISKDCQDPGWWKGELNGKIGVFPDNFVTIISSLNETTNCKEEESKSLNTDAGAIKPISTASQRKSLESKNERINGETNITNKTPPLPGKKPLIPIKKSPSCSGVGILSEIKKKIVDVVDGAAGSKNVTMKSEVLDEKNSSENDFDQIERRSLLTDIRATRAKAPGRRLPTAIHKDEDNTVLNGNSEHVLETSIHIHNNIDTDSVEKRRIREWEKHKAPWLEEMKLNQAKRTSTSPGPENKIKLTPITDGSNVEVIESNLDKSIEKQGDLSKSMQPLDLSKSLSSSTKQKITTDMEKTSTLKEKPNVSSGITNRQSVPLPLKDNSVVNRTLFANPTLKDPPTSKPPLASQTFSSTAVKHTVSQIYSGDKSPETPLDCEKWDIPQKQYNFLLERLQKLEVIVEAQKHAIEDLRNKLQIETDMRMMFQEQLLKKL